MDSDKCAALLKVIEVGNIHAAAKLLGYTPSGISRMMASLEQELGITLLARSKRGVVPTQACRQMIPAIKRVAAAGDALMHTAEDLLGLNMGELRIGIAYPQYLPMLLEVLGGFRKEHPNISIRIRQGNSTPLAEMLSGGEIDLAVISHREGDFLWQGLIEDSLVAVVPLNHPLAKAASYPLKRFETDSFIEIGPGEDADNYRIFSQKDIKPNITCSVSDDAIGMSLVEAQLGVTLSNNLLAQDASQQVAILPTRPKVSVPIGLAYAKPELATPAVQEFSKILIEELQTKG